MPVASRLAGTDPRRRAHRQVRRPPDVSRRDRADDPAGPLPRASWRTPWPACLVGGFFLGLGGTTFAIGVPFVNAWFPPGRRGFAIGVFGMGTGGTALASFTTVPLTDAVGRSFPFVLVAVLLAIYAVTAHWRSARQLCPAGRSPRNHCLPRIARTACAWPSTWQLAFLYAVAFGGFVAFSVYLPTYLTTAYASQPIATPALRTAGLRRPRRRSCAPSAADSGRPDRCGARAPVAAYRRRRAARARSPPPNRALVPVGTIARSSAWRPLSAPASGAVFALVAALVPTQQRGHHHRTWSVPPAGWAASSRHW